MEEGVRGEGKGKELGRDEKKGYKTGGKGREENIQEGRGGGRRKGKES